jgi:hypothetical protein
MLTVLTANTRLATGGSASVNDATALMQLTAKFPAVLLTEGQQTSARIAYRKVQTKLTVIGEYYDQWVQQSSTTASVWQNIADDLRRMRSNLEDNPRLVVSGTAYAKGVVHVELSPFIGQVLAKSDAAFPVPVALRTFTILVNLFPYTVAA